MKLSDLPARELARLDAICLEYESRLRTALQSGGDTARVESEINTLVERYGGQHAPLLRAELEGILQELKRNPHVDAASVGVAGGVSQANGTEQQRDPATPEDVHSAPTQAIEQPTPLAASPDKLPRLGDTIGPYTITDVLGRGGMGIVYRATDARLDRSVAIKMLALGDRQSQSLIERFQREAKAVAGLTHPHIVELFDIGVYQNMPYVVMEHLRGETLLDRIKPDRLAVDPISTHQVQNWGIQLADALATAHAHGVIHRDIKPENVMVMDRPRTTSAPSDSDPTAIPKSTASGSSLKLFDFGLSRMATSGQAEPEFAETLLAEHLDSKEAKKISDTDSSTRVGAILGTPGYMAPEQARGGMVTPAADVFSLGCVLFEAMYGRPAFSGETATKRFAAVLEKQPLADPVRRRENVALSNLIMSMLGKDPEARPTAAEILTRLQANTAANTTSRVGNEFAKTIADDAVVISRRRIVEIIGGAVVGGALGATLLPGTTSDLRSIRSLAVLRFQNANKVADPNATPPAGDRILDRGELLSGLLVNELSRIDGITVPKYVPLTATQPLQFRNAADLLEVDALVTGTFSLIDAAPAFLGLTSDAYKTPSGRTMTVNIDIISGTSGKLLKGLAITTTAGDNLIEQAALAQEIAEAIGRELKQSDANSKLDNHDAFTCLVKGRTLSDPDTMAGMKSALACFEHAISVDSNYADAHAGQALTAISLAARENDERASELIAISQEACSRALALSPQNRDGLLARAMLDYQILADFDSADAVLSELTRNSPNHWQIHHQAGWLKIIQFEESQGMQFMRRANGLHPASRFLKTELARAEWFRGNADRAIQSAISLLRGNPSMTEEEAFPRGLLIDIYEQSGNLADAAKMDPELSWRPVENASTYYAARERRLLALPYGPFGPTINNAILQIRRTDLTNKEPPAQLLSRLITAQLPMLPLALCKHPAMISMTMLEQAIETYSVLRFG
jgi:serine/threonine protein kinase/tetratricopeptide (TPR) repeat protein